MSLLNDIQQAATPAAPSGFKPGVVFQGSRPVEVVTPPLPAMETSDEYTKAVKELGYPIPDGYMLQLVEMQLVQHENFWTREKQGDDATTKPSTTFRYRFKVVPESPILDSDLDALMGKAKAEHFSVTEHPFDEPRVLVVSLADFQTGKAQDLRGGTEELLARSEAALAKIMLKAQKNSYSEIVLIDAGDSTEGFESSPTADRTNDLSLTAQIRVWRRIFWRWIDGLARVTRKLTVIAVPSNHCRTRRGKAAMGDALDDWGIEVLAQVRDIAEMNPDTYGHVDFIQPEAGREHVVINALGTALGAIHGHQASNPNSLPDLIKKNARRGIGMADVIVCGHFHHLRVINFGIEQTLFVCPANDAGSGWFQYSGEEARPGILTFEITERGWDKLDVIWTD